MAVFVMHLFGPDWPHGRGDIDAVAAYTGLSEKTIRQLVAEGRFPRPRYRAGRGPADQWYAEDLALWRAAQIEARAESDPPAEKK